MQNPVVIKGNKAGMTVYSGSGPVPLQTLLRGGRKEIQGDGPVLGLCPDDPDRWREGGCTPEEEFTVVNADHRKIPVSRSCASSTADAERASRRCEKALNEKLMELSCQHGPVL